MKKTKLILLGAGKIGDAILNLLSHTGDYELTVADRDPLLIGQHNDLDEVLPQAFRCRSGGHFHQVRHHPDRILYRHAPENELGG